MLRDKREAVLPPLHTLAAYGTEFFFLVGENSIPYFPVFFPERGRTPLFPRKREKYLPSYGLVFSDKIFNLIF
jgi:hypothetical protein